MSDNNVNIQKLPLNNGETPYEKSPNNTKNDKQDSPYSFHTESVANGSPSHSPMPRNFHNDSFKGHLQKDSVIIKLKKPANFTSSSKKIINENIEKVTSTPKNQTGNSLSIIKKGIETSCEQYEGLYRKEFQFGEDGSLYYNPKPQQQFILSCSPKKDKPKINHSELLQTSPDFNENQIQEHPPYTSSIKREKLKPEEYGDMRATGTALTMSRRKQNKKHNTRRIITSNQKINYENDGKNIECGCKRFHEKWQKITEVLLENNRALKVQVKNNESPVQEIGTNYEQPEKYQSLNKITKIPSKTMYKSYLNTKYKEILNKSCLHSEYAARKSKLSTDLQIPQINESLFEWDCDFTQANEKWKKKVEIESLAEKTGFKKEDELFEKLQNAQEKIQFEEKIKKIKLHAEQPDLLISDLKTKYGNLYDQITKSKKLEKRVCKTAYRNPLFHKKEKIKNEKFIHLPFENYQSKVQTYLTEVSQNMQPDTENINTEIPISLTQIENKDKKVHIGNENFPEILESKFGSQKPVNLEQRNIIENFFFSKFPFVFFVFANRKR